MEKQLIFSGTDEYEHIADIIRELHIHKLLLVCGKSYEQLKIKDYLSKLDVKMIRFSDYMPNPVYDDVSKGVLLFRQEACQAILAVGGGSAIDVAKCIKLFCCMDSSDLFLEQEYVDSEIPLIAVPTTAGSGSESTRHAVIYWHGEKQSITHPSLLPEYVILDSSMLKSLPAYQKKCTLLDALCQGIESWWSVRSTHESRMFAASAVKEILAYQQEYIEFNSEEAAEKIMHAANLAGQAIDVTATTAAHAMSYKLTSMYGLPHGHAVAICLPEVWEYMISHIRDCVDPRGERYVRDVLKEISDIIDIPCFRGLIEKFGLMRPTVQGEKDIMVLSSSVNPERLKNHPIAMSRDVLQTLYERILSHES